MPRKQACAFVFDWHYRTTDRKGCPHGGRISNEAVRNFSGSRARRPPCRHDLRKMLGNARMVVKTKLCGPGEISGEAPCRTASGPSRSAPHPKTEPRAPGRGCLHVLARRCNITCNVRTSLPLLCVAFGAPFLPVHG
jgi:hypothetical protein